MFEFEDIAALERKTLCRRCIGDGYLKREIQSKGELIRCSYCNRSAKGYTLGILADRLDAAFDEHFIRTSDQLDAWEASLLADRESSFEWYRPGDPVEDAIAGAMGTNNEAARDLQRILEYRYKDLDAAKMGEETAYAEGSHYAERGANPEAWRNEWEAFEHEIRTETRYFSSKTANLLSSVFRDIDRMKTWDGRWLVTEITPSTDLRSLYRARTFQSTSRLSDALKRPDLDLGPPPSRLAAAGRMNAAGISVFYGADSERVAVAEVRPPVGSRVAVARFDIIRPLRLLDLSVLKEIASSGSVFDPEYGRRLEREAFLRTLSARLTRAVVPDDESSEYLVTQVVADYLASDQSAALDGILFPSVQAGEGRNVALFHKAARVEEMDLPRGTTYDVSLGYYTDEGWDTDYVVTEVGPATERVDSVAEEPDAPLFHRITTLLDTLPSAPSDKRQPALRVDPRSVVVHEILAVAVQTESGRVWRYRQSEDSKGDF